METRPFWLDEPAPAVATRELVAAAILGGDDQLFELFAPSRLLQLDPG